MRASHRHKPVRSQNTEATSYILFPTCSPSLTLHPVTLAEWCVCIRHYPVGALQPQAALRQAVHLPYHIQCVCSVLVRFSALSCTIEYVCVLYPRETCKIHWGKKTAEVKSEGMRPEIEDNTSPDIVKLFEACWHTFVEWVLGVVLHFFYNKLRYAPIPFKTAGINNADPISRTYLTSLWVSKEKGVGSSDPNARSGRQVLSN